MKKINNFFVSYNKNNKKLKTNLNTFGVYYMGYLDDEFIKIEYSLNNFLISNDKLATIPCFVYDDNNFLIVTSQIKNIIDVGILIDVDSSLLHQFFSFGYLPGNEDTLYKNITFLKPNSNIIINNDNFYIKNNEENIFQYKYSNEDLLENIFNKMKKFSLKENLLFGLTGGNDSIFGLMVLKKLGIDFNTAVFGNFESVDVKMANYRRKIFNIYNKHNDFILDSLKVKNNMLFNFSNVLNGMGNLSAIYGWLFDIAMVDNGYIHHIRCDHFEVMRRFMESNICDIINRYTTPSDVVLSNFNNIKKYYLDLEKRKKIILKKRKYDLGYEFYLHDRYIKGQGYKNAMLINVGGIKMTLPINYKILNLNRSFIIKEKQLPFNNMIKKLSDELGINYEVIFSNMPNGHFFPHDCKDLISKHSELFLDILSQEKKYFVDFFNIESIERKIKNGCVIKNEEWFILRFMCLLMFKNYNKIGII